ncbi:hypothetical protein MTO96_037212 [Rhipicephalus appendiculatus]
MRPKKGLAIRNFTTHQISRAVAMAGNSRQHCTGDHFIIRTRPGSNIIIASTPPVDTAQILRRIATLTLEGKTYEFNTNVAVPEDTLRGVIHGIEPGTTPEELTANLRVRTQAVTVHSARMLGATKAAVLTFEGPLLPRYALYYGGGRWLATDTSRRAKPAKSAYNQDTVQTFAPRRTLEFVGSVVSSTPWTVTPVLRNADCVEMPT